MPRRSSPVLAAVAATLTLALSGLALGGCGASTGPEPTPTRSPATSAAAPARTAGSYVALGDSYAAAPGVPTTTIAGGCFRSDHDYPRLLAATLHTALTDVTCSGATTGNLIGSQRIVQVAVPPQFDALKPTTTLVTLGIGGNDLDLFEAVLDKCLIGADQCLQGVDVPGAVRTVQQRLTAALQQIHRRSPSARVVLVGYPQLIPADDTGCAVLPADRSVLRTVRGLIADFSTMMARAARDGRATYVDLVGPSAGHDICSTSPWINGDQDNGQAVRFHPLLAEQQAVTRLIAQALG